MFICVYIYIHIYFFVYIKKRRKISISTIHTYLSIYIYIYLSYITYLACETLILSVEIAPFLTYCTSHLLSSTAYTSYWLLQGPLDPVACDSVVAQPVS